MENLNQKLNSCRVRNGWDKQYTFNVKGKKATPRASFFHLLNRDDDVLHIS